jgi:FdhE protein
MNIGEVANPPFAVLPEPARLFERRAERLDALAPGHELAGYLSFLARLARAQHALQQQLPPPALPPEAALETAQAHGMPPVSIDRFAPDELALQTLAALLDALAAQDLPPAPRAAVGDLAGLDDEARRTMMRAVLDGVVPEDAIAEHVLVMAALQVHFARLAAQLDAERLTRVADSACPACGGGPVASLVVGWPGAAGTRFCCCSICSTHWHVVRIKCLICGTDRGISYHSIEGGSDVIKAETCEACRAYVKILHHHKDAALEPFADDVASLGLDLLLREEGWQRASANPFLAGY